MSQTIRVGSRSFVRAWELGQLMRRITAKTQAVIIIDGFVSSAKWHVRGHDGREWTKDEWIKEHLQYPGFTPEGVEKLFDAFVRHGLLVRD